MTVHAARVFISYAHANEPHCKRLAVHLSPLIRQGIIQQWHDRMIVPGANWSGDIDHHLEAADLVLLLVSADFVASDYCYTRELEIALRRNSAGLCRVVPIFVEPIDCSTLPLMGLQGLPRNAKPVSLWSNQEEAWRQVAVGVRKAVDEHMRAAASSHRTTADRKVTPTSEEQSPPQTLADEQNGEQSQRSPFKGEPLRVMPGRWLIEGFTMGFHILDRRWDLNLESNGELSGTQHDTWVPGWWQSSKTPLRGQWDFDLATRVLRFTNKDDMNSSNGTGMDESILIVRQEMECLVGRSWEKYSRYRLMKLHDDKK
jgi:hypothetical protein